MKYSAACLLLNFAGNEQPAVEDVKFVLSWNFKRCQQQNDKGKSQKR